MCSVFPPLETSGHQGGKGPISRKKLEKGDARFEIETEILAFMMNGACRTVKLSKAKAQSIAGDITKLLWKSHVSLKRFRSVLGRPCSPNFASRQRKVLAIEQRHQRRPPSSWSREER
jgi:hypothetical protein